MHRFAVVSVVLGSCTAGSPPGSAPPPAPVVHDVALPDATVVRTCDNHLRLAIGELVAPANWCWRRIEEGDDLSGQLIDDHDRVRAHYELLAFDERVPNPCPAAKRRTVHGRTVQVCQTARGRTCASLDGRVNLCTDPTIAAGFDVATLGEMFVPRQGASFEIWTKVGSVLVQPSAP